MSIKRSNLPGLIAIAAFLMLAMLPVAILGWLWLGPTLAGDLDRLAWAVPTSRSIKLLFNSFLLAATAAAISTILGTGLALWLTGTGRARRLVGSIYLVPLLIPPYIQALQWMAIAGRRQALDQALASILGPERFSVSAYGFWPAALVLSLALFPIVTLMVRAGLNAIQPEIIESALLGGTPWRVARRIILPLIMPSVLSGAGLVAVLTLVEYGVPSVLQFNVYIMDIYATFGQGHDVVVGLASSIALFLPAAVLLALSQWRLRNSPLRRTGLESPFGSFLWPAALRQFMRVSMLVWVVAAGAPVLVLLIRGGLPSLLIDAVLSARSEIGLTIFVAVVSSSIATLIALPLAVTITRRSNMGTVDWFTFALPLAIPAPVTGMALIYIWNQPLLDWGYGTSLMLMMAHVARFLPFAVFAAATQVRHVDPLLIEAASLARVGLWRRLMWIRIPLMMPAVSMAWLIVFVLSIGELGAALLVAPPGEATLPMRIYNLLHYGATDTVSALSLVILLVAAVSGVALMLLWRRLRVGLA